MKMHLCLLACVVVALAAQTDFPIPSTEDTTSAASAKPMTEVEGTSTDLFSTTEKEDSWSKPSGYDFFMTTRDFHEYFVLVLPIFALVTNSLSLFVFIMRGKKEQTVNMLLIALTISDMLSLVVVIDFAWYSQRQWSLMQQTRAGCKLILYVANVARDCSSWFILTFTVDRLVAVWFPLKRSTIMTKRRVQCIMLTIVVLSCAAEIYSPILYDYIKKEDYCGSKDVGNSAIYTSVFRNTFGFLLPSAVVAVLNGLIIHRMQRYQAKRSSMMSDKGSSSKEGQNRSLTIMLVTISTWSITCYLPRCIFFFYLQFPPGTPGFWEYGFGYIVEWFALLNYACNFFFYCLTGSQFRRDLKNSFRRVCSKGMDHGNSFYTASTRQVSYSGTGNATRFETKPAGPRLHSESTINSANGSTAEEKSPVTSSTLTLVSTINSSTESGQPQTPEPATNGLGPGME